jgi:rubredoxin
MGNETVGVEPVRLAEGVQVIDAGSATDPPGGDYVAFRVAGDPVEGEYHCSGCGYGVAGVHSLPVCPMCGGTAWEERERTPLSRAAGFLSSRSRDA